MSEERNTDEKVVYRTPPKMAFAMGILAGISLASLAAFIMTFTLLQSDLNPANDSESNGTVAGVETDTPTPTADPTPTPTADPTPSAPTKVDIAVRESDHVKGAADAPVTLIEYSDFECSFCGRVQPTLDKIFDEYEGQVKLVYRHFPLSFHTNAQKAGEASECAAEQGKFWEMHDLLFENQTALDVSSLKGYAKELGLNTSQFDSCLDEGKYADLVSGGIADGTQYGVQGTPATFVNGMLLSGAQPYEAFKAAIDDALSQK